MCTEHVYDRILCVSTLTPQQDVSIPNSLYKKFAHDYGKLLHERPSEIIVEEQLIRKSLKKYMKTKPMKFEKPIKPLYWAINVSDLRESVYIFELLGAKVLKHEEFDSETQKEYEGSYFGPYHEFWSQTLMGWGTLEDSFCIQLTYNYRKQTEEKAQITKKNVPKSRINNYTLLFNHFDKEGNDMKVMFEKKIRERKLKYSENCESFQFFENDIFVSFEEGTRAKEFGNCLIGLVVNTKNLLVQY